MRIRIRTFAVIFAASFTMSACGPPPAVDSAEPAAPPSAAVTVPWALENAAADTTDGIRVLVLHDMEGLSGEDDWRYFEYGQDLYAAGQELLAADVNAVIDGLFAGGATEVHVVDGHGSGNPEPDVRADLLDPRATQVLRDAEFDSYFDLVAPVAYDAVAVVGMHAKTGSGGFASHTFTLGIELQIHGQPITETELVGLSWGREGIPVIFASGDDRLRDDLQSMPWIEYVTVKTATSASTVQLRPVDEARADLRAGAERAVRNLANAKVMKVSLPVRAAVRAVPPASLALLQGVPGIDLVDDTVSFTAADLRAAYDGMVSLVTVAGRRYTTVLNEVISRHADAAAIRAAYGDALTERWLDVESGRWSPPPATAPETGRRYHGYQ